MRENSARCLHPFVVDRPADRSNVDADLIGDLLHFQRFDELRASVEEGALVLNDGAGYFFQRGPALLDRLHEPLGRRDLLLQIFARLGVFALVFVHLHVTAADVNIGRPIVEQPDAVIARFRALHGAATAARLAGNRTAAEKYYGQLLKVCERGDKPGRAELQEARHSTL